jgi:hypothetical protein
MLMFEVFVDLALVFEFLVVGAEDCKRFGVVEEEMLARSRVHQWPFILG